MPGYGRRMCPTYWDESSVEADRCGEVERVKHGHIEAFADERHCRDDNHGAQPTALAQTESAHAQQWPFVARLNRDLILHLGLWVRAPPSGIALVEDGLIGLRARPFTTTRPRMR